MNKQKFFLFIDVQVKSILSASATFRTDSSIKVYINRAISPKHTHCVVCDYPSPLTLLGVVYCDHPHKITHPHKSI